MFLRVQIKTEKLAAWFTEEMRRQHITLNSNGGLGGTDIYYDHLEIADPGTFRVGASADVVLRSSGSNDEQHIQRPVLQFVQPIRIYAANLQTVTQSSNGTPESYPLYFNAVFDMTMSVTTSQRPAPTDENPSNTVEERSIQTAIVWNQHDTFLEIPSELVDLLLGGFGESITAPPVAIDLAGATQAIGLQLVPVHAGIIMSSDGLVTEIRVEMDSRKSFDAGFAAGVGESVDVEGWRAFYGRSGIDDFTISQDWGVLIDKRFLTPFIADKISEQLNGDDRVSLLTGPSVTYSPGLVPKFTAAFNIDVVDACQCFWEKINVNVDITQTIGISIQDKVVKELIGGPINFQEIEIAWPGDIRQDWHFDIDKDDLDVFCCEISATTLWPIIGGKMLADGDVGGGIYALGLLVTFIDIIPLFLIAFAKGSSMGMDGNTNFGNTCRKISDEDVTCYAHPQLNDTGTHGYCNPVPPRKLSFTKSWGHAQGPVLVGSLEVQVAALPQLIVELDEFGIATTPWTCSTDIDKVGASVYVSGGLRLKSSNGYAYAVASITVVDDPEGAYVPGNWISTICPFSTYVPIRLMKPVNYPCKVLISTSVGIRMATFEMPPVITEEGRKVIQLREQSKQIQMCHIKVDEWYRYFHRFDPKWNVDPGPEMGIKRYLWRIVVSGVLPGDQFALLGKDNRQIDIATVGLRGTVSLGALLPSEITDIGFQRLQTRTTAGKRLTRPKLDMKQTVLVEQSRLSFGAPLKAWNLASTAGRVDVLAANERGVFRTSLARPGAPETQRIGAADGSVAPVGSDLAVWRGNLLQIYSAEGRMRAVYIKSAEPIHFVAASRGMIVVGLHSEIVVLSSDRLQTVQRLKLASQLHGLTSTGQTVYALIAGGMQRFMKTKTGLEHVGTTEHSETGALAAASFLETNSYAKSPIAARFEGKSTKRFDDGAQNWLDIVDVGPPWFEGLQRVRNIVVSQADTSTLRIETIGAVLTL